LISTFELNYDLTEEMNATVLKDKVLSGASDTVPLYIKTIMANIQKGDPMTSVLSTAGNSIFKNANRKPALTSNVLKEQNFLTGCVYKDTNAEDLSKTTKEITTYLQSHISPLVHSITPKQINYTLKKGSTVRASLLNGKLTKISYALTSTANINKTIK